MKTKAPPRAAGVVVFRRTARGIYYLILRAYNNWDFPKGLVEAGENQLTCAKRELREETGLATVDFPFGHEYRWVTHDEAEDLLAPRLGVVLEWAKRTISGS